MYGIGFTDIDEEKLASGEYAGYSYETNLLLFKTAREVIKRKIPPLEKQIYEYFGFPLRIKDFVEKTNGWFIKAGGCDGEIQHSINGGIIYGNPWAIDISKDNIKMEKTINQARLREKENILINCENMDKAIPDFLKSIDKSASPQFKKLIGAKVKTVRTYNKLLSRLPKLSSWPKSLAHLKKLDKFIKKNYQDKMKDDNNLTVTQQAALQKTAVQVWQHNRQKS